MAGLNDHINVSFLIIGHTKISPDWCFGLLRRAFQEWGCLDNIVRVVEEFAEVNHAQFVGGQVPRQKELPPIVPRPGLSLVMMKYLFEKIQVLSLKCKDSVCPELTNSEVIRL